MCINFSIIMIVLDMSMAVTHVKSVSSLMISCLYMSSSLSTCALSLDPDSLHAWSAPEAINALDKYATLIRMNFKHSRIYVYKICF